MSYFPPLPPGYFVSYHETRHMLVAFHQTQPLLYLDEQSFVWKPLDTHVSEVNRKGDACPPPAV